jgi:hypothetical protein
MAKRFALLVVFLVGGFALADNGVDESRPYGRVCVTVLGPSEGREEAFRPASRPGPGERISVSADANVSCEMIVAAFHPATGRIANHWMPQMIELAEWDETRLPKSPAAWNWPAGSDPFEIYVLFADSKSPDVKALQSLVAVMLQSGANGPLLDRQALKLRELITRSIVEPEKARQTSGRSEIGGTFRGGSFRWRPFASRVNFNETKPGLLIFPGPVSGDSGAANGSSAK